ncbi:MAG: threonine ammonia-lyase [Rhodothalassiaceae bacterium]|nr:MAG: threonine ammonia-lyase [Rhodothalassiaceae bacterium]
MADDAVRDGLAITLEDVEAARDRIRDALVRTPVIRSGPLSDLVGAEVFLKLEIFQYTASFKERGALNRLLALSPDERRRGVVAMSAGNHAQGVARHAARLGIPATIVMPRTTPFTKVRNTERLGAEVVLVGDTLQEALDHARRLEAEGRVFIHPFDDPLIMAGQGTLALEFLKDVPDLDALIVPIGGGGLMAGVAVAAKGVRPDIRIFGVQSENYPSMKAALEGREITPKPMTVAEGIAVKAPGRLTLPIVRALVDDIFVVEEWRIEDAIDLLAEVEKIVVEGAGAAPLAALRRERRAFEGRRVGLVVTGGNIDPRTLTACMLRRMVRDGRLARLKVTTPDVPGSLSRITAVIGRAGGNILDVVHQRPFAAAPVRYTEIELVVETKDRAHTEQLIAALAGEGFAVENISGDTHRKAQSL